MRKVEILAPAGSMASLKGAVAAGCDAVYIGGGKFGARAYADNPESEDLISAIDFVHLNGKKIYLTVNTLLKNNELETELYDYLKPLYERGLDAVIVQDFGVLRFVQRNFPDIAIHGSTQMTVCSDLGGRLIEQQKGVTRIVPARELSISEIRKLREETKLEIECFVHGALCYSYSGQCLFSSMIGGRSGNRGRCAQPCRQRYELSDAGKVIRNDYIFSLKDLCTLDSVPDLIDAGIDSFKIEGRMKKPEYSAYLASAYSYLTNIYLEKGREGYDKYLKQHPDELFERMREAADLYNRGGFTKGYYFNYHGLPMMTPERPNHSGVSVGKVSEVSGRHVCIKTSIELNPQDVLDIRGKGQSFEFTVGASALERMGHSNIFEIYVSPDFKCQKGFEVFRTRNDALINRIDEDFLKTDAKGRIKGKLVANVGEQLLFAVDYLDCSYTAIGDVVDFAKSKPMSAEDIKAVLNKTGESEFAFEELEVFCGDNVFLPVGKIKEIRRNAFLGLKEAIINSYCRTTSKCSVNETSVCAEANKQEIIVKVSDKKQLTAVLQESIIDSIYLDLQTLSLKEQLKEASFIKEKYRDKKVFLCLPPVFRRKEADRYERDLDVSCLDGIIVNSLDEVEFVKRYKDKLEIRASEQLYVMNEEARLFIDENFGIKRTSVSLELNESELSGIDMSKCNLVIYGRTPVVYSAQCVRDNFLTCLKKTNNTEGSVLVAKDRTGAEFLIRTLCPSCLNVIYNSSIYSLIGMREMERLTSFAGYQISFTIEDEYEVNKVLEAFKGNIPLSGNYTRGHMRRGVE